VFRRNYSDHVVARGAPPPSFLAVSARAKRELKRRFYVNLSRYVSPIFSANYSRDAKSERSGWEVFSGTIWAKLFYFSSFVLAWKAGKIFGGHCWSWCG
jgi:hypothetical protein